LLTALQRPPTNENKINWNADSRGRVTTDGTYERFRRGVHCTQYKSGLKVKNIRK